MKPFKRPVFFILLNFIFLSLSAGAFATENPKFLYESFDFNLKSGKEIHAKLLRPVKIKSNERLPLLFVFGGFEEAGKTLELLKPKEKIIFVSFDYPFDAPRRFRFPKSLIDGIKFRKSIQETLEGISLLTTHLFNRPEIDPTRVGILGASFGCPFAVSAAAHDPRLSVLILIHGFADIAATVQHRLDSSWRRRLGPLTAPLAWISAHLIQLILNPPRPEIDASKLNSNQKVFVLEALEDEFIPSNSRALLWESLLKSKAQTERSQMSGGHLLPGASEKIRDISDRTEAWLKKISWLKP